MNPIQSFTSALEKKFHKFPTFFKIYSLPYTKIVEREISLAGINPDDTVINVGCGSLPFTAVKLAQMTGAEVYAIDNDEKAILSAAKIVDELNLNDKIDFMLADGKEQIQIDFDKAIVALQVDPQDEVVNNLIENSDDSDIVVRIPRKKFRETYGPLPDLSETKDFVKHDMLTFDRSVVY